MSILNSADIEQKPITLQLAPNVTVENFAGTEYHRIGSDIYWEFEESFKRRYADTAKLFSGTALSDYIQPVRFSEAMGRFAEYCCNCHGTLFGEDVKYFSKRDTENKDRWYLSFYTGKIDSTGKLSSNYFEVARIVLSAEYDGREFIDYDVAILEKNLDWLVKTASDARRIMDDCFLLTEANLMKFCAEYCNDMGFRYNDHGGNYFLPHVHTDNLYAIKKVLNSLGLYFAIKPVIAGKEEDIEDILRLIGTDFREVLAESEKRLFQSCLYILSKESEWLNFKFLAVNKLDYSDNYIAKTRYGKILVAKLDKLARNASELEYTKLAGELLDKINPDKNASYKRVLSIRNELQDALQKIKHCSISPLVQNHYNRLIDGIVDTNKTIQFLSKHIENETLSIEF
jgi:hypothetical protein